MKKLGIFHIDLSPLFREPEMIDDEPHFTVAYHNTEKNVTHIGKMPVEVYDSLQELHPPRTPPTPPKITLHMGTPKKLPKGRVLRRLEPGDMLDNYRALFRGKDGHIIDRKTFDNVTEEQASDKARAHAITLGEKCEDWSVGLNTH